jgi:hypothetical protein
VLERYLADAQWHPIVKELFFDFGKSGNPLSGKQDDFLKMLSTTGFTQDGAQNNGLIRRGPANEVQTKEFHTLVLNVSVYWIYRVRSSIAHSRIGEYVMTLDDERFVEQFAEKLLRRILASVLR